MQITKELLKEWSACRDGYGWFVSKFPQGAAYTEVSAALRADKRYADDTWLASNAFRSLFNAPELIENFVKADVDATKQNTNLIPVAGEYMTLRVQVTAAGAALFFVNGVQVGTQMDNAVSPNVALTPTFALGNTSLTVAKTADVDYIGVSMKRNKSGSGVSV